ncbi:PP2C family protein-serine/threonine phosphatase [Priestia abyssalis]|uniref:PP2C family protein-serine/threonine phosphatase n=1 Tax=Priestia abyssalis TaxID=1221450 RepID=UPI0014748CC2|nr:protein phosphatase 2C domain-containing protein [Priestia abyssalis]
MRRIFQAIFALFLFFIVWTPFDRVAEAENEAEKSAPSKEWTEWLEVVPAFFERLPWWSYVIFFLFVFSIAIFLLKTKKNQRDSVIADGKMSVIPGNAQHIGSRIEQQDAFGFSDISDSAFVHKFGSAAVLADGMGGLAGGKEASQLAVQTFLDAYMSTPSVESIGEKLLLACQAANSAVVGLARRMGLEEGVGTTLIAAVVHDKQLFWLSVGDSRIYLLQNGTLHQLTTDHVYARELDAKAEWGEISREEAFLHPERNSLTSFIGLEKMAEVDYSVEAVPLFTGNRIILCSDGLYGSVSEAEMIAACRLDTQEAAEKMVEIALSKQKPHQDNVTAAMLTIA